MCPMLFLHCEQIYSHSASTIRFLVFDDTLYAIIHNLGTVALDSRNEDNSL